jgi:hypothetical protein
VDLGHTVDEQVGFLGSVWNPLGVDLVVLVWVPEVCSSELHADTDKNIFKIAPIRIVSNT